MNVRRSIVTSILTVFLVAVHSSAARPPAQAVPVTGYVLDSACAFIKNLTKPVSRECALACAKAGSPLVILADDGTLYWPISSSMPATGQNQRLMKFAGQRVNVSGTAFERGGSRALVIQKIEPAPAPK